jgi:hypothetical protein
MRGRDGEQRVSPSGYGCRWDIRRSAVDRISGSSRRTAKESSSRLRARALCLRNAVETLLYPQVLADDPPLRRKQ